VLCKINFFIWIFGKTCLYAAQFGFEVFWKIMATLAKVNLWGRGSCDPNRILQFVTFYWYAQKENQVLNTKWRIMWWKLIGMSRKRLLAPGGWAGNLWISLLFPHFPLWGMGDRSGLPDDKMVFIFYFLCLSVVLGWKKFFFSTQFKKFPKKKRIYVI
jgi:hypothetical protein